MTYEAVELHVSPSFESCQDSVICRSTDPEVNDLAFKTELRYEVHNSNKNNNNGNLSFKFNSNCNYKPL